MNQVEFPPAKGRLVLVVGPSGVGKDSLLDGAREALFGESRIHFPRRVITRPAGAGGEDHVALSEDFFERLVADDAFALMWEAHGLRYGVPAGALTPLVAGEVVVINVSRTILDEARRRWPVRVVSIEVTNAELERRLRARGREDEAGIQERLQRARVLEVEGDDVVRLDNSGSLEETVGTFVTLLSGELKAAQSAAAT